MIPVSESDIVIIFPFDSREYVPYSSAKQNNIFLLEDTSLQGSDS